MFYKKSVVKSLFIIGLSFLSLQAQDEHNESQIFLDKYSSEIKKIKKDININNNVSDISAAKIYNDTNISDAIRTDANNIVKNILVDKKQENAAKSDLKHIHTSEFKKKFTQAKDNFLYDKKLNWSEEAVVAKKHIESLESKHQNDFYFNSNEMLYIFISSSMPNQTILHYLESTKHIQNNVVFVLQGTIGGMQKIKPTLLWIKKLISKKYDNAKIIIEPRISKNFNIEKVPAIFYTQKQVLNFHENPELDTYIFYGDMPIAYAIKKMLDKKENIFLSSLLKKLETK